MRISEAKFAGSSVTAANKPSRKLPEFAFIGRSNVGKSSLINALMMRKNLARTSGQPGKTQTINYYYVEGRPEDTGSKEKTPDSRTPEGKDPTGAAAAELYLVDLPGYGYTRAAGEIREKWGKMIERYLQT